MWLSHNKVSQKGCGVELKHGICGLLFFLSWTMWPWTRNFLSLDLSSRTKQNKGSSFLLSCFLPLPFSLSLPLSFLPSPSSLSLSTLPSILLLLLLLPLSPFLPKSNHLLIILNKNSPHRPARKGKVLHSCMGWGTDKILVCQSDWLRTHNLFAITF